MVSCSVLIFKPSAAYVTVMGILLMSFIKNCLALSQAIEENFHSYVLMAMVDSYFASQKQVLVAALYSFDCRKRRI